MVVNLDIKDKKLLYELDVNSRRSYSEIGKNIGLKKDSVNYRVKRLFDEGVITNFIAKIDVTKFGYLLFNVFLKFQNISKIKEKELLKFVKNHDRIGWGVIVLGNWNLAFIFWAKSETEFYDFWKKFISKFGEFIDNKEISLFYKEIYCPKLFFLKNKFPNESDFVCSMKNDFVYNLDKLDLLILSYLAKNSRIKYIELSKLLNVSPKKIFYKIKQLEKNKVILGYGVSIDCKKINFDYFKLEINFKKYTVEKFNKFIEYCKYHRNIVFIDETIGGNDIKLSIYIENKMLYKSLVDEIKFKFSDIIKNYETMQYYDEFKFNLFPICIDYKKKKKKELN